MIITIIIIIIFFFAPSTAQGFSLDQILHRLNTIQNMHILQT